MLNSIIVYILFGGDMSNFISDKAELGKNITLGKNIIIENEVIVRDNCCTGYNVVIRKCTTIGKKSF